MNVISLAINSSGHIFVGTYSDGVYRSTDNGSSWTLVLGQLYSVYEVFSLAFDSSGNVYAGTHGEGLFRSTNDGQSWGYLSNDNPPNNLPQSDVYAVATNSSGTIFASDYGAIYRSTDGGSTWAEVRLGTGGTAGLRSLACAAKDSVYTCGVNDWFYYSTNNGTTWNWEGSSSGLTKAPYTLASSPGGLVFAGTQGGGVFKSTNCGVLWSASNVGLTNYYINTLSISRPGMMFAGTYGGGVLTSLDYGGTWTANNNGLTFTDIRSIAFDPYGNVFAGAYANSGNGGLWRRPVSEMTTSAGAAASEFVREFQLLQNYPNPFNPSTSIRYGLPKASQVNLSVYDMLGREVARLADDREEAGVHEVEFDGSNLATGVYFYRLRAGDFAQTRKLQLIR
jgi:photosystem II stability/assembly factor-like uncharacterized protein